MNTANPQPRTAPHWARYFFLLAAALLLLTLCDTITARLKPRTAQTRSILFVGNSYTDFNGGLDQQIAGLYPDSIAQRIAPAGYTLENHWNDANTLNAIRAGKWNYVVLQEQSQTPVLDPAKFSEYASRLDAEIKKSGAQTILLMTWERPDSIQYHVTTANLAASYNNLGLKLGARVAPAGTAFARSVRARPDLVLYNQDGHPTTHGTFLAACVLYATLFSKNPTGNSFSDKSISADDRNFLERIAAETMGF